MFMNEYIRLFIEEEEVKERFRKELVKFANRPEQEVYTMFYNVPTMRTIHDAVIVDMDNEAYLKDKQEAYLKDRQEKYIKSKQHVESDRERVSRNMVVRGENNEVIRIGRCDEK